MAHRKEGGDDRWSAPRSHRAGAPINRYAARRGGARLTLFGRWVLLVYIPLGLLAVGCLLLILGTVSGKGIWLLLLLAAYCVLPVRLLVERRRRELSFPTPRDAGGSRPFRPVAAAPQPPPETNVGRLTVSQRAMAGIVAIAALLLLGGILLVFGMGRLDSSLGLLLAAIGGFLMILSVTVPTFRLFDLLLRAAARLIGRRTRVSGRTGHQTPLRTRHSGRSPTRRTPASPPRASPPAGEREESRRLFPPDLY